MQEHKITRFDLCNYGHGRFGHISKKRLRSLKLILENKIVYGLEMKTLLLNGKKMGKIMAHKSYAITPGFKGKGFLIRVKI